MVIGESIPRIDGKEKVLGKALYGGDYSFQNGLYLKVLRSPVPHGIISRIQTDRARSLEGVVEVLTARDLHSNQKYGLIIKDQEVLCSKKVRYLGDPLALVAGETEMIALEALSHIQVEYLELPVISSIHEAKRKDAPKIHEGGNLLKEVRLARGDVKKGFQDSTYIFSHTFQSAPLDQVPLQPEAGVAWVDEEGILHIRAATQWLHDLQAQIALVLNLPLERVRLIQPTIGGAFGKREDISVHLHLALMALRTKRPVKMTYSREESMIAQAKRHPIYYKIRTGLDSQGKILAWEGKIYGDTGAYASGGPAVIRQALFLAPGPYYIPNIKGEAYLYYTNNTFCGAMRGFGGAQSAFAYESNMDMIASQIGMDPEQIRSINALKVGSKTPTGQRITSPGMMRTMEEALKASSFNQKRGQGGGKRGYGMATTFFGIGYGEGFNDHAYARVLLKKDGLEIWTAGADLGQGLHTLLVQIGASVLAIPPAFISIKGQDTLTYSAGSTSASRQTFFSGNAVKRACEDLKMRLFHLASSILGGSISSFSLQNREVVSKEDPFTTMSFSHLLARAGLQELAGEAFFFQETTSPHPETGQGSNLYVSYAFATQVAEVEVDRTTGQVQVLSLWGAHDVGKAIHPQGIQGQVEGGVAMGLGMALLEEQIYQDGVTLNPNLTDYLIPTILDVPKVETIIVEEEDPLGPFGARGVGEPATLPTTPAILNAIYDAVGVRIVDLPATPEKIFFALRKRDKYGKGGR